MKSATKSDLTEEFQKNLSTESENYLLTSYTLDTLLVRWQKLEKSKQTQEKQGTFGKFEHNFLTLRARVHST